MSGTRQWDILGIGTASLDLFLSVERLPGHDEKVLGSLIGELPGGVVANFCCAASRLGARTAFAGVVGDDRHGALAVADLRRFGVDVTSLRVLPGGRTEFCVVLLDATGEKAIAVVLTECSAPESGAIDPAVVGRARLVHLMASSGPLALWAAREARARDTLVSLDLEPAGARSTDLADLLRSVDLVFPNAAGLAALHAGGVLEGARRLLEMGPRIVAVTLGAAGCLIVTRDATHAIPAVPAPVVDTTGAGDCFNGAFVTGYLRGWPLARCGQFASAAAAASIGGIGARGALPTADEAASSMARTYAPWSAGY